MFILEKYKHESKYPIKLIRHQVKVHQLSSQGNQLHQHSTWVSNYKSRNTSQALNQKLQTKPHGEDHEGGRPLTLRVET